MEEGPAVEEKPIFKRLFVDEKPDLQALQIKEEPLALENKHASCCFSKEIDRTFVRKQCVGKPCENAGTSSKPEVFNLFQEGNSRERNLFPGDSSLSINCPDGSEAEFPQYTQVKQEFCVATNDCDLIKTEQSEREFKVKTEEEACIARLQAHVEAYSSTFSTEYEQKTESTENVGDNKTRPQFLICESQGKNVEIDEQK
ncbi:hypothetical protein ElyMa_000981800 [Elysia marginata]|uniref:Uncharacterized protein n=1 Tax=Elysia marginata TaxID=1093978 RepID=A0AAV4HIU2_9GAST|nr:hypothetical protein ElyMa_000981800 [Elysia marginata]